MQGALSVAYKYGGVDGESHKQWVIDQMVQALTGGDYEAWIEKFQEGEEGPDTYIWDGGMAP